MKFMARSFGAAALLLTMVSLACTQPRGTNSAETAPEDLAVTFGVRGLAHGRMQGYTIRADGVVWQWEGRYPEENKEQKGRVTDDVRQEIWKRLRENNFSEIDQQAIGTTAYFIIVKADGERHEVSWPAGPGVPPAPLKSFYSFLTASAETAAH